ncbi:unnamed protein product [Alopecurus aequalis]
MPSLEFFWGVEVKPGQTLSCDPGKDCILRLSQAALGETKKGSANIVVSAKIDGEKVIVGTLSAENHPQLRCDFIFHKEIELSHNSKTASVFLCGYRAIMPDMPEYPLTLEPNTTHYFQLCLSEIFKICLHVACVSLTCLLLSSRLILAKLKVRSWLGEVKTVNHQVIKDDSDSSSTDDLSSSDDDLTEDDSSSEDDTSEGDDNSSEEDDSSSEESYSSSEEIATSSEEDSSDEEVKNTPKKPEDGRKRVAETALKTPASEKKAKIATSSGQTTGDKKASKVPGNSDSKPKAKSPKSGGTHACKSCTRTFGSDAALQSHEKAKHA